MNSFSAKISIIIPCFNEVDTIEEILKKIFEETKKLNFLSFEIIVVDDASTDGTKKILQNLPKYFISKLLVNNKNYGKGHSLIRGIKESSGDIVLFQDADLEYDPSDYSNLLKPILSGRADVVYGSRFLGGGEKRVLFFWHRAGNFFLTLLSNILTNLNLTDMEAGYKVFKSDLIKSIALREQRFGIEPEITAKLAKTHCRIYEVGVSYFGRTYDQGKKITWKDGFSALRCIFFYNLFSK